MNACVEHVEGDGGTTRTTDGVARPAKATHSQKEAAVGLIVCTYYKPSCLPYDWLSVAKYLSAELHFTYRMFSLK